MNRKIEMSFIIPAYNVEKYIEKCIRSVQSQTITDIEIIVIDDGSEDETGGIIDKLCREDNRIIAIHQCNRGVSASRNIGLRLATGEYIAFVDGDDYISKDFACYMLGLAHEFNADFCFSTDCFCSVLDNNSSRELRKLIDSETAVEMLLSPRVMVGCWNKIYRLEHILVNDVYFREDLFYGEGLHFIITYSQICERIAEGNKKVYYYRKNNDKSATSVYNVEKIENGELALDIIWRDMILETSRVREMMLIHRCLFAWQALVRILCAKKEKDYPNLCQKYNSFLKANILHVLKLRKLTPYRKIQLLGGVYAPRLMSYLYNKKNENKKNISV